MNTICESKRRRLTTRKPSPTLEDELAEKDAEIGRLHIGSIISGSTNSNVPTTETRLASLVEQRSRNSGTN